MGLAIMLGGTGYPLLMANAAGRADHGMATLLFWAMSAGFVRGVGCVPRRWGWRGTFSGWACAAALLVTPTYLAKFDMGESLGNKAFFAAIIGGFNNSRGALLGGVIVGVCENLAAAYISPSYKDAVALVLFMVVILFKPQGLMGTKEMRKV